MSNEEYARKLKGKSGVKRIINAAGYSKDGLRAAYRHESAFRQLIWLNGILLVLVFVLDFGPATRMMLIIGSFLSLIVELFNTAIEAAVDHTSTARHELAKRAKDAGSAAQMLALALLAVLWFMALWREYGLNLF
ncbi:MULTISPECIES: diacylglycerol kinase [unclassified Neisseria]|uniref:diacylglycerol kinase n=1 Tax=unclassified Neisseria TaxID=2623750 RepID=UPI0026661BE5|nr:MULTISPECIES: diacylglycerol kinase [unclassified Neisseria]MDO1509158.1 diacylglycerol kinase [Neisseria sp. MVDL19-042950]MDO1515563.1 diacylglycerol kinase [Neisseria sp. MVDL18-041461]MDO1562922.1 diacylglycerol kinase [Neisseria sp. MVDL20-010259]